MPYGTHWVELTLIYTHWVTAQGIWQLCRVNRGAYEHLSLNSSEVVQVQHAHTFSIVQRCPHKSGARLSNGRHLECACKSMPSSGCPTYFIDAYLVFFME